MREISLEDLKPSLTINVLDIDGFDVSEKDKVRYDCEVPVMFLESTRFLNKIELPRISPRLKGDQLFSCIQKILTKTFC